MDRPALICQTKVRPVSRWRIFWSLAVLIFAATWLANQTARAEEDDLAPLRDAPATKMSRVKSWKGFWEVTTYGQFSSPTDAHPENESARDSTTHGEFELFRDPWGKGAADGFFEWTGEAEARISHVASRTILGARGHYSTFRIDGGGPSFFRHMNFTIEYKPKGAHLAFGNSEPDVPGHMVGYSLTPRYDDDVQKTVYDRKDVNEDQPLHPDAPLMFRPGEAGWTQIELFPQIANGPATITVNNSYPAGSPYVGNDEAMLAKERLVMIPIYDDLECEVTIKDYAKWRPRGSVANPSAPGNGLIAKAVLSSKSGDNQHLPSVASFRFELYYTSREPGVCLNWPLDAKDQDYDLRIARFPNADPVAAMAKFRAEWGIDSSGDIKPGTLPVGTLPSLAFPEVSADGQKGELKLPLKDSQGRSFAEVAVESYDFGARAELRVTCVLQDGREIMGLIKNPEGRMDLVRLPLREPGQWIAQSWRDENDVGQIRDSADDEKVEGQPLNGDGYTLYEEYRGWVVDGKHVEGDPKKKDFFVLNAIGDDANGGIALFERESKLRVLAKLNKSEMSTDTRLMNGNHAEAPHRVDQHGVWMFAAWGTGIPDAGTTGMTAKDAARAFRPGRVRYVTVEPKNLSNSVFGQAAGVTQYNLPDRDASFGYDRAVAHELFHSVGVDHHGEGQERMTVYFQSASDPNNASHRNGFTTSIPNVTDGDLRRPPGYIYTGNELQRAPQIKLVWEDTGRDVAEELAPLYEAALAAERARAASLSAEANPDLGPRATAYPGYGRSADYWRESEIRDHVANRDPRFEIALSTSGIGETNSGNELCLMRYYFSNAYPVKGQERAYYLIRPGTNVAGRNLCHAPEGTGANASSHAPQPRFGDAASGRGDCFSQICPNDAIPPRKL